LSIPDRVLIAGGENGTPQDIPTGDIPDYITKGVWARALFEKENSKRSFYES
jgi:hypothetical protein